MDLFAAALTNNQDAKRVFQARGPALSAIGCFSIHRMLRLGALTGSKNPTGYDKKQAQNAQPPLQKNA